MTAQPLLKGVALRPPGPQEAQSVRFHFGDDAEASELDVVTGLSALPGSPRVETWYPADWRQAGQRGNFFFVEGEDYLLTHGYFHAGDDICAVARNAYSELLGVARDRGFGYLVKAWNYLPEINRGRDDEERYRQFCVGRGLALDNQLPEDHPVPAATAIGCPADRPLAIIGLWARAPGLAIENPRQVSAFEYPRQYGPRSPFFSRATVVADRHLLLSGTAAIVGHRSLHPGDGPAQLRETLANLHTLVEQANMVTAGSFQFSQAWLRVYLRDPALEDLVYTALPHHRDRMVVVCGDICRAELLLEIDGMISASPPTV